MAISRIWLGLWVVLVMNGSALAATLTASQNTVSAPGSSTTLYLTLAPDAGTRIAAIQADVTFDGASLTIGAIAAGDAATAAGKDVSANPIEDGKVRVVVAGVNQNIMAAGIVAQIPFTINPSAGYGAYTVGCDAVVASDEWGAAVTVTGVAGAVNVGKPAPYVIGLGKSAAQTAIVNAGLAYSVVEVYNDTIATGLVIDQSPTVGNFLAPGATVTITVSKGAAPAIVPDVGGLLRAAAETAVANAGLVPSVEEEYSSDVLEDTVISQEPAAGSSVVLGATVVLHISKGPAPVTVPNVTGIATSAAQTAIINMGLVPVVEEAFSSHVVEGYVISQSPEAGNSLLRGESVTITVSKGPASVTVPNVEHLAREAAQAAIEGAELAAIFEEAYSGAVTVNTVISQNPVAGSTAAAGSSVVLTLSKGPAPIVIPNVAGLSKTAAQTAITNAGLIAVIHEEYSTGVAAGLVISQSPAFGNTAAPGTTVTLSVSKGPEPVTVPNVAGLARETAQTAITSAGLVPVVTEAYSNTIDANVVISQSPEAGEGVVPGASVTLSVSLGAPPVTVPNVLGMNQSAAESALVASDLAPGAVVEQYSTLAEAGKVIGQQPLSGADAPAGSSVNLVVSKGPAPVSTPDVVGMDRTAAETALSGAGLAVGAVSEEYSVNVAEGVVISQNPASGAQVAPGASVALVVSKGAEQVGCFGGVAKKDEAGASLALHGGDLALLLAVLNLLLLGSARVAPFRSR